MYIVTAVDDYKVTTRLVVGCDGPIDDIAARLFKSGFAVDVTEAEDIDRTPEEIARAQGLLRDLFVMEYYEKERK